MIKTFNKAKHWQLFLLVFALPFIIYIGWLITFFSGFLEEAYYGVDEFPAGMFDGITYMLILMMIPMAVQYGWFWSMAIGLQQKLPPGLTMKVNRFKVFFLIPVIYMLIYMFFLVSLFGNIENLANLENLEHYGDIKNLGLIILGIFFFVMLSFFIVFCSFYQFWFIAKTVKSAELQREAVFSEFVGEFFLLWFYPIGVWIIQPVVNRLMASD